MDCEHCCRNNKNENKGWLSYISLGYLETKSTEPIYLDGFFDGWGRVFCKRLAKTSAAPFIVRIFFCGKVH